MTGSSPSHGATPTIDISTASTVPQPVELVFANSYQSYMNAGWRCIIPMVPGVKDQPPGGFTGEAGIDTTPDRLAGWAANGRAGHNVVLRMHDGVIGVDVDDYVKAGVTKTGATTLAACEAEWGELPPTWCSTARGTDAGPGLSGIRFFRTAPGRYRTKLVPDIEIIQRHHRYALVAPSLNPEAKNAPYRWYRPDGTPAAPGEVPGPGDLPELPAAWVHWLRVGAAEAGAASAGYAEGEALRAALLVDDREPCAEVANALDQAESRLADEQGSRHDSMLAPSMRLVMLGAAGHPGVGTALERLAERWGEMTGGEDREAEFERMVRDAAGKAVTEVGQATPVAWDPCLVMAGGTPAVMAVPGVLVPDGSSHCHEPPQHPWPWFIGAGSFDPKGGTDQALAAAVLKRVRPMLRFAADTTNGWLKRGADCWELHGDLTGRAVTEVAELMPPGETPVPKLLKDRTEEHWRAWRRAEFMSSAGSGRIERKMRAAVQGGGHPSAVNVAGLDAELEVLWAGGVAWDLRASGTVPTPAHWIGEGEPHMRSAAVRPDVTCPMPLWEAFITAVWPDEPVRMWALRVLSIALTGHADRALPVLLGPPDTGKTSVVELMMKVLGSYAHAANAKLLATQDNSHDTIIFDLKGRRLSFIDEGLREGKWAQERLKHLTGGGSLTGRAMNKDAITFEATHTLIVTSNAEPVVTDDAVRSRVRLIPCEGVVETVLAARAALTPQVMAAEAPGILAGFMRHAAAWLADRNSALTRVAPASISGRADELAKEQDPIRRWLDEMCEPLEKDGTPSRQLFNYFAHWHQGNPIFKKQAIPSETAWGTALTKAGYPMTRTAAGKRRPLRIRQGVVAIPPG